MTFDIWYFLSQVSSVASTIGAIIAIILLVEARKIRKSFLRRARLPAVTRDLRKASTAISNGLNDWNRDKRIVFEQFAKVKGLLENLRNKVPNEEKKRINEFLRTLQPRRYLVRARISQMTEDSAWDLYTELSTIIERLSQLIEDTRWE